MEHFLISIWLFFQIDSIQVRDLALNVSIDYIYCNKSCLIGQGSDFVSVLFIFFQIISEYFFFLQSDFGVFRLQMKIHLGWFFTGKLYVNDALLAGFISISFYLLHHLCFCILLLVVLEFLKTLLVGHVFSSTFFLLNKWKSFVSDDFYSMLHGGFHLEIFSFIFFQSNCLELIQS